MTGRRVLHVSANRFSPLPVEHNSLPIWRELAAGAEEYHVVARSRTLRPSHTCLGNIHLHLIPSLLARQAEFFFTGWIVAAYIRRLRPTHLVLQCPVLGGIQVLACARLHGIPTFMELHGEHHFDRGVKAGGAGNLFRTLAAFSLARASKVRALSPEMKAQVEATFGREVASRTVIVPTRVDLQTFSPPKSSYALSGPLRLITAGAFVPVKNHLALVRALHAARTPAHLTIVGGGPLQSEYEAEVAKLGMQARVTLSPWVEQRHLANLLAEHDVYVHYSNSEGLSRAVLEAMAMGLPIIATRVGFIEGVLEHDDNCILLHSHWAAELATALERLAAAQSLRATLGVRGYRTVVDRFEWQKVFDLYRTELYGTHRP